MTASDVTDPLDLIEERLHALGKKVKRKQDGLEAQCPHHDDRSPSLGVKRGDTRDLIIKCQAGCSADDVMESLGLKWTDLGPQQDDEPTIEYDYHDEDGRVAYTVVRFPGKKFRQRHHDPIVGKVVWSISGLVRRLYHLPAVLDAVAKGDTVWVVEGEKDADRLTGLGCTATCNSGGADDGKGTKFTPQMADWLAGAEVWIVADKDAPGLAHARHVRALLLERGCTVVVKQAAQGKDVSDHLNAGRTLSELVTIDLDDTDIMPDADATEGEAWPAPIPIGGGFDALPTFPVDVFPAWIADHVRQVARELQVPVDLPAMLVMVALSACAAKRADVWLTRSWREQLCLYVVVAMPPGAGKSPAFSQILGPLAELETSMIAEALPRIEESQTRRAVIEKSQRKAIEKGETTDALMYGDELRAMKVEVEPRLFVDDVTVEKLGVMLKEQGGRLALTSTEGGLFDQMIGRYSEKVKASLDPYLQMWSGDTVRVDRIGRESVVIDKPALTIGVTVQPTVLEALRERPELKGRGLTARFMYSLPKSNVGYRNMMVDAELDERITDRYTDGLRSLWNELAANVVPQRLEMTPQAKATFMQWRQMLEEERRPGGAMTALSEWSTKVESSVARAAGLLHLAHGKGGSSVDSADMAAALTVGEYWITHAQAVHEMWGTDATTHVAQSIVKWLDDGGLGEFSVRDCYNANRQMMPRADDAIEPLSVLVERGWVQPLFDGPLSVGKRGKPSPRFAVHPELSSHVRSNHAVMRFMRIETQKRSTSSSSSVSTATENPTHEPHEPHDPVTPPSPPTVTILPNGQRYNLDEPWT
jgi:putative DNA primase/helicase